MNERFIWETECGYDESLLLDTTNDDLLSIEDCKEKLNYYDAVLKGITDSKGFEELLGLMTDNNLNWESVTNIIKEALNEL